MCSALLDQTRLEGGARVYPGQETRAVLIAVKMNSGRKHLPFGGTVSHSDDPDQKDPASLGVDGSLRWVVAHNHVIIVDGSGQVKRARRESETAP